MSSPPLAGEKIKCPKCGVPFAIEGENDSGARPKPRESATDPDDDDAQVSAKPKASPVRGEPGLKRRAEGKSRRHDDEEDEDDRPQRRPRRSKQARKSNAPLLILGLAGGGLLLLVGVGLAAYFLWPRSQPQTEGPKGPSGSSATARGFASPDAALDADRSAILNQDVAGFKAVRGKDSESLETIDTMAKMDSQQGAAPTLETAYKNNLKFLAESRWTEGRYKRFPAELLKDDKAFIICINRDKPGALALPDAYRRYEFTKIDGQWYLTADQLMKDAEVDRAKYK
jgi:hypothetical protein